MNPRIFLVAVVLLAVAIFLAFKGNEGKRGGEELSPKSRRTPAGFSEGALSQEGESSERTRSRPKRTISERPKVQTTGSGLQYEVVSEGSGDHPSPDSKVKVHYVGTLEDGTVFDSSRDRGEASTFPLNAVIKGWIEGLQLMKPGAVYRFVVPPDLAYGDRAMGGTIPASSTLTFEVELISIESP